MLEVCVFPFVLEPSGKKKNFAYIITSKVTKARCVLRLKKRSMHNATSEVYVHPVMRQSKSTKSKSKEATSCFMPVNWIPNSSSTQT